MWVGERFVIAEIKGLSLNSRHLRVKVKALTSANVPEKKRENRCEADPFNNHHLLTDVF